MAENNATPAANVLGTIGTVLWCIQLVPQIIYNYRKKECTGLPPLMMFLWSVSGVPFAIYFIVQQSNIPVQVQPHVFMSLSLVCFGQSLFYPPVSMRLWKVCTILAACVLIFAGVEAGCIFPFKTLYHEGTTWPVTLVGVIAAVLLGAGLLPPYFELWKRQGQVVGINFIFLSIDTGGAVFSILSLIFQRGHLDILGCILYVVIVVLEGGIFISHISWMVRTRKQRRLDRAESHADDENAIENDGMKEDGEHVVTELCPEPADDNDNDCDDDNDIDNDEQMAPAEDKAEPDAVDTSK